MSRVVLISPPFRTEYMRNARCDFVSLSKSTWFPIWLGQAGSYLQSRGHQTRLMDAQAAAWSREYSLQQIAEFKPDMVAVYSGRLSEESDLEFADAVAAKGIAVVFVGPYTSIDPVSLLKKAKHVRLAIQREFDLPLEELASGADPTKTPNVFYRTDSGEVGQNIIRPLYKTEILDTFPLLSAYFHEQIDVKDYKTPSEPYPFLDLMSGRGCAWGRCNFCLWVQTYVPGSVYNLRSIGHFMQEFDYIEKEMPFIKSVMIQDDMLTNSRAKEIAEALLARNSKIQWSCYAKPNSKLTDQTLALMKQSGCLNLHVGFESGDDQVLENIDKGSTVAQALEFSSQVKKAGLHLHGDFAIGHLGETDRSADKTIELARKIQPHTAQFQVMIPFKATRFWQQLEARNAWSASGEPSYEKNGGLSSEQIRAKAKAAYRRFYISPQFLWSVIQNPWERFFSRLDQYARAIPAVFWKRWEK